MLTIADLNGYWLAIFLTFCVLSFLYKDNPFYKIAEHLFIGVSIGYVVVRQYLDVLKPKLFDNIESAEGAELLIWVIPLILAALMFTKASKRFSWMGRYPLAFVVGLFAGLQVNNVPQADLIKQAGAATRSLDSIRVDINTAPKDELVALPGISPDLADRIIEMRTESPFGAVEDLQTLEGLSDAEKISLAGSTGHFVGLDGRAATSPGKRYWFGIFSNILLFLGLIAALIYFYFSVEHSGTVGRISKFGIWILMIGFGASFGYTVQGRISLAIGRAMDVSGLDKAPQVADQIHGKAVALVSIVILVIGIVLWERRGGGSPGPAAGAGGESSAESDGADSDDE